MRYFFISYTAKPKYSIHGTVYGNTSFAYDTHNNYKFPSKKRIEDSIYAADGNVEAGSVVISNIFEFESVDDFNSFNIK